MESWMKTRAGSTERVRDLDCWPASVPDRRGRAAGIAGWDVLGVYRASDPNRSSQSCLAYTAPCMYTCIMATKTISIDLEAYERLRAARRAPNESFSRVIKRAHWRNEIPTAAALLDVLGELPTVGDDVLTRLDDAQHMDTPPEDQWRSG